MSSKNTVVLYHKNCDDGFGAAWAAWNKFQDTAEYIPINYQDRLDLNLVKKKNLIILDFSFPRDYLTQVLKPNVKDLILIDHHKSAMMEWTNSSTPTFSMTSSSNDISKMHVEFNMNKSGALLAWEYFYPGVDVPKMISHISDADLYKFEDSNTKNFKRYLNSVKKDFETWKVVSTSTEDPLTYKELCQIGGNIQNYHNRMVIKESMSKKVRKISIPLKVGDKEVVYSGLCINTIHPLASDIGSLLAIKANGFSLMWETDGVNCYCSLRSIEGFDCLPIAKHFNGGGHKTAAGFSIKYDVLSRLIETT